MKNRRLNNYQVEIYDSFCPGMLGSMSAILKWQANGNHCLLTGSSTSVESFVFAEM